MGRHRAVSRPRRSSLPTAVMVLGAAMFFAVGADVGKVGVTVKRQPVGASTAPVLLDEAVPCCAEIVAMRSVASPPFGDHPGEQSTVDAAIGQPLPASRWRTVKVSQLLPAGVAPEKGLQVKTILTARSISAVFPEIHNIGGVRPDALRWHPDGLALDVTIPNPGTAEGIALGNQIVAYVLKNADRLGIQDAIWRNVYYTPNGPQGTGVGHWDHVHVTTIGGGYPAGGETYAR